MNAGRVIVVIVIDAVLARWSVLLWLGGWASLSDDAGDGVVASSLSMLGMVMGGHH